MTSLTTRARSLAMAPVARLHRRLVVVVDCTPARLPAGKQQDSMNLDLELAQYQQTCAHGARNLCAGDWAGAAHLPAGSLDPRVGS